MIGRDHPQTVEELWGKLVEMYACSVDGIDAAIDLFCVATGERRAAVIRRLRGVQRSRDARPSVRSAEVVRRDGGVPAASPDRSVGHMQRHVGGQPQCPGGCGCTLQEGEPVVYVAVGPGWDVRARNAAASGRDYVPVNVAVCGPCATGVELPDVRRLGAGGGRGGGDEGA